MLAKVRDQVRYRRALRALAAPTSSDPAYFSRFGGLWTDRRDAGEQIDRRLAGGAIDESEAQRLRHWIAHGYVILERGVEPNLCDKVRSEVEAALAEGDERLLMTSRGGGYEPLTAGRKTDLTRVVDIYAVYESALSALFSEQIVRFLESVFDDVPLLFQSLTFEKGSQQAMHQDPGFVVVASPLEFAAAWIALEDINRES
jgi:hypothetical protein